MGRGLALGCRGGGDDRLGAVEADLAGVALEECEDRKADGVGEEDSSGERSEDGTDEDNGRTHNNTPWKTT